MRDFSDPTSRTLPILFLGLSIVVVVLSFFDVLAKEWDGMFKKDLYGWDESTNSVVTANLYRQLFPAALRLNPLDNEFRDWREGPGWQHIPPLFAYVPLPFFALDGRVSIEGKRLSYAMCCLLTVMLFVLGIAWIERSATLVLSAVAAGVLWLNTRFTRCLFTGLEFGTSDLLLALVVTAAYLGVLAFFVRTREERLRTSMARLVWLSFLVSLPLMTKHALGAIPAATVALLLVFDHRRFSNQVLLFGVFLIAFTGGYYALLYLSAPDVFRVEFLEPFRHVHQDYEEWGRPWHFFLTVYLPQDYLSGRFKWYLSGFIFSVLWHLLRRKTGLSRSVLLGVSWFAFNLVVVSSIQAKSPNFLFQSYLFSLYFITHGLVDASIHLGRKLVARGNYSLDWPGLIQRAAMPVCAVVLLGASGFAMVHGLQMIERFKATRARAYPYASTHEHYFQAAEALASQLVDRAHLVILSDKGLEGRLFRYYILFLTGAEARTVEELEALNPDLSKLNQQYPGGLHLLVRSQELAGLSLPAGVSVSWAGPFVQLTALAGQSYQDPLVWLQRLVGGFQPRILPS